jgi:hypothetical protein
MFSMASTQYFTALSRIRYVDCTDFRLPYSSGVKSRRWYRHRDITQTCVRLSTLVARYSDVGGGGMETPSCAAELPVLETPHGSTVRTGTDRELHSDIIRIACTSQSLCNTVDHQARIGETSSERQVRNKQGRNDWRVCVRVASRTMMNRGREGTKHKRFSVTRSRSPLRSASSTC